MLTALMVRSRATLLLDIPALSKVHGMHSGGVLGRYWERHGLLPAPERQSGQRRYPPEAAQRITLLRKFQQAGLTLTEIGEFQQDRPHRQAMIRSKLGEIEQRMIDLDHAHQLLEHALLCGKADILTCATFQQQMATWSPSP